MSAYYYRQYMEALVVPSPTLVWEGKPRAHARIENSAGQAIDYSLNGLGWRAPEFDPLRPAGNAIALGDSFTFGLGVAAADRFTDRLERYYRGLAVWNLGVMGYAPDQYLLLAQRWLPPVPWRFAILQLSNNDVSDIAQHAWERPNPVTGIPAALRPPFGPSLVSRWSEAWNVVAYLGLAGAGRFGEASLEEALGRLLFSLRETARIARERRIPLLVVQATDWGEPAYGAKVAGDYRAGVVKLAREENFSLFEAGPQELLPAPDLHWTSAAHHKVADALSPEVFKILFPGVKMAPPR